MRRLERIALGSLLFLALGGQRLAAEPLVLVVSTCAGPQVATSPTNQLSEGGRQRVCRVLGFENQAGWHGHAVGLLAQGTGGADQRLRAVFRCANDAVAVRLHEKTVEADVRRAEKRLLLRRLREPGGDWQKVSCEGKNLSR